MTSIVLRNARILDVVAGAVVGERDVVIADGRIKEIGPMGLKITADIQEIDVHGRVIMPGLCDAHVHTVTATGSFVERETWSPFYAAARMMDVLRGMLYRGFTTVRDAGGADWGMAAAIEQGFVQGPRLLFCGKALSQTGGHGDMRGPGQQFEQCLCCPGLGQI